MSLSKYLSAPIRVFPCVSTRCRMRWFCQAIQGILLVQLILLFDAYDVSTPSASFCAAEPVVELSAACHAQQLCTALGTSAPAPSRCQFFASLSFPVFTSSSKSLSYALSLDHPKNSSLPLNCSSIIRSCSPLWLLKEDAGANAAGRADFNSICVPALSTSTSCSSSWSFEFISTIQCQCYC